MRKRVITLAAAGASALVLGGVFGTTHRSAPVEAAAPIQAAIGCANSNTPSAINFSTINAGTIISSTQNASAVAPGVLQIIQANGIVECGAVFEDAIATATTVGPDLEPDALDGNATYAGVGPGSPQDLNPSTIDGGTITYTLTAFSIFPSSINTLNSQVATILEGNGPVANVQCGATQGTAGFESCQGANIGAAVGVGTTVTAGPPVVTSGCWNAAAPNCAFAWPQAGNIVHVALRPGATFNFIGGNSPAILIQATYNRFASLSALAAAVPPLANTVPIQTNNSPIGIVTPSYTLTVTPSPAIIPAASGTGVSSTLTAAIFHNTFTDCTTGLGGTALQFNFGTQFVVCGAGTGVPGILLTGLAGAESGVVTFSTSSGVFGSTAASPGTSAQQVFSTHCGQLPATAPVILIPTFGLPTAFSLSQCISATANLFGGGNAGTAVVVANYVGDYTGAAATATTTVSMSPTPATVALSRGCNEVITSAGTAVGTLVTAIVGQVTPGGIVVSVWQFNNSLHAFQAGYFSTAGAPLDFTTTGPSQSLFLCVSSTGTFPTGAF